MSLNEYIFTCETLVYNMHTSYYMVLYMFVIQNTNL